MLGFVSFFGCQYQCHQLPERLVTEMTYCVRCDVKPYRLTHSQIIIK